ncbi:MAG: phage terminase small subunit P27 family [Clostridia bacterium]|nr:phage terminase small subunit P27 family [Clostridia bacterium]
MARPAKVIDVQARHNTKDDISMRSKIENDFKGDAKVIPPVFLTEKQRLIFEQIVSVLEDYIGELDGYVISEAAITIDRLQEIDEQINLDRNLLLDKDVITVRKAYTAEFFRYCNELCLSPQARAKIGSLAVAKEKKQEDPILKIFGSSEEA